MSRPVSPPSDCQHDRATCDDCGMGFTSMTPPLRPSDLRPASREAEFRAILAAYPAGYPEKVGPWMDRALRALGASGFDPRPVSPPSERTIRTDGCAGAYDAGWNAALDAARAAPQAEPDERIERAMQAGWLAGRRAASQADAGLRDALAKAAFVELHWLYRHAENFGNCGIPRCADRRAALAASPAAPRADAGLLRGDDIRKAIAAASDLTNPRLSEVDWNDVATALTHDVPPGKPISPAAPAGLDGPLTMTRLGVTHELRDDDIRNTLCGIWIGAETWHPAEGTVDRPDCRAASQPSENTGPADEGAG